jgi:multiple sugar transport system permease protein
VKVGPLPGAMPRTLHGVHAAASGSWRARRSAILFMMLLPCLGALTFVVAYPTIFLLRTSLQSWNLLVGIRTPVGLANYAAILSDRLFQQSVLRTLEYSVVCVLAELALGFVLATLFNREVLGVGLLRTLLVTPLLIAPVATGLTWRFMYEPSIGVINQVLRHTGLPAVLWISSPRLALTGVGIAEVWQWTPFVFLVLLAGFKGLSENLDEAAQLDGASWARRFWLIQVPLLRPVILVVVLLRFIDIFRTFDLVYVMTRGGPGDATYTLAFYNYVLGFTQFQVGMACAAAVLAMAFATAVTTVLLRQLFRPEAP